MKYALLLPVLFLFSCGKPDPITQSGTTGSFSYTYSAKLYTNFSEDWDNWRFDTENDEGFIRTAFSEDWDNWDFSISGYNGDIKTNFSEDWDNWRLYHAGQTLVIQTNVSEDWDNWRIYDPSTGQTIQVRTSFSNDFDRWNVSVDGVNILNLSTSFSNDFDNWYADGDIEILTVPQKVAVLFIPLFAGAIHSQDIHLL